MSSNTEYQPIPLKEKLKIGIKSFSTIAVIWLGFMLFFRVIEVLIYSMSHALPANYLNLLYKAWLIDAAFWLPSVFPLCLLYLFIHFISIRGARLIFSIVIILFFTIHILLVNYYNTTLVMLGADLFSYSFQDIKQTVGASGKINITSILSIVGLIGLIAFGLYKLKSTRITNFYFALALPLLSFVILGFGWKSFFGKSDSKSEFTNNIISNKSKYFYDAAYDYKYSNANDIDIYSENYLKLYADDLNGQTFNYIDKEFPFLHTATTYDALTPFFTPKANKPDIVIIVVEGLGSAYSNKDAYLGSFTPFLDSLSTKSLYWKNFLSNGGRTFAILPSLIGSLPYTENGFLDLGSQMPKHLSLINLLKHNHYKTSFYYGGNSQFDNMNIFLKLNGIDKIIDESNFPESKIKLPEKNDFSWGYGDFELYDYFLESTEDTTTSQPHLSILLTVSSHSPFLINNQSKYLKLFEQRIASFNLPEDTKADYKNYANQYATILYADEALKSFFSKYKKRANYDNTIFLITGDHRIPEIPISTKIDRYHVPLIIYSPLLNRTAEIASISSHFDITPSLVSYLKTNHGIKTPLNNTWLGKGLDTTAIFQNINSIPLMQSKTQLIDFVMDGYHLNDNTLFKLNENLGEYVIEDSIIKARLQLNFKKFKIKNTQLQETKKLLPDSLLNAFINRL